MGKLTDEQLRTFAARADYPLQDVAAELLASRSVNAELVALLRLAFQTLSIARLDHDLRARISVALAKDEDES